MIRIRIAGTDYDYPDVGENPNWGRDATEVIIALAGALNSLIVDGDILVSQADIKNNITIDTVINGLIFDNNKTQSATVTYNIYRSVNDGTTVELIESGRLFLENEETAPAGEKWKMSQIIENGDSSVLMTIADNGQIYYTSSEMTGVDYKGIITFQAKTLPK